jgi:hypothetical protein
MLHWPGPSRAVITLVPTITGMGNHVSEQVWSMNAGWFTQVLGLPIYHIYRHVLSTFKRLTHGTTH